MRRMPRPAGRRKRRRGPGPPSPPEQPPPEPPASASWSPRAAGGRTPCSPDPPRPRWRRRSPPRSGRGARRRARPSRVRVRRAGRAARTRGAWRRRPSGPPTAGVLEVPRPVQPAVDAAADEVERSAAARWRPPAHPLAIASWMVWPNVSLSPGCTNTSRLAIASASSSPPRNPVKTAPGSRRSSRTRRTLADDDEPRAGGGRRAREVLDLLLGCESPDVADDHLVRLGHAATPRFAAPSRGEPLGVDAAAPEPHPLVLDPGRPESLDRGARRREGEGGAAVEPAEVARERGRCAGHAVSLGIRGDVGLVHRDGGDAQRLGGRRGPASRARTARRGARPRRRARA